MTADTTNVTDQPTAAGTAGALPGPANDRGRSRSVMSIAGAAGAGDHARVGAPATRASGGAAAQDLLRRCAQLPAGHPDRATLRARGIEANLPLARRLAARYSGRGEPLDDLYQVAALALVKAVDGYDPNRQTAFTSYAVPTIIGALKRHFRDTTWRVQAPRRIQELAINVAPATAGLAQQLGRSPTSPELAAHLGATQEEMALALRAWQAYHPDSLDAPSAAGPDRPSLADTIGAVDTRFDAVTDRHTLRQLLTALPVRERRVLALRYFGDMTQSQIAAQVGVSQMQISRLLLRALTQLRAGMLTEQPPR
jgi:RNA polymerase sigma-B factor